MSALAGRLQKLKPEQMRQLTLASMIVVAGVFYWHFTTQLVPLQKDAREKREEFEENNDTFNLLRRKQNQLLDEQQALTGQLDALPKALALIRQKYDKMAARMVGADQLAALEDGVALLAAQAQIRLLALDKRALEDERRDIVALPFSRRRYVLDCTGSFPAAVAFLSLLEQTPWPVTIARTQIQETKDKEGQVLLTVEMDLLIPDANFAAKPPALGKVNGLQALSIRDLFPQPVVKKKVEEKKKPVDFGELILTGIVGTPQRRSAVLNGLVVRQGSKVNGAAVVKIEDDRAVLEKEGQRKEVVLRSLAEKQGSEKPDAKP